MFSSKDKLYQFEKRKIYLLSFLNCAKKQKKQFFSHQYGTRVQDIGLKTGNKISSEIMRFKNWAHTQFHTIIYSKNKTNVLMTAILYIFFNAQSFVQSIDC